MSDLSLINNEAWYKEGLRFKCTGCGKCCSGAPGYVWLNEDDIKRISKRLNLSKESFLKKYTRQVGSRISLKENLPNYDCVFLKDNNCVVYKDRPNQCRTFPFWKEALKSPEAWEATQKHCEGIDHPDAPLIPLEEIEVQRNLDS